jgi:ferredoxin
MLRNGSPSLNARSRGNRKKMTGSLLPKTAAMRAAAAEPVPPIPLVTLKSSGVALIYGRDAQAVEAGNLLKADLDVTVLITQPAAGFAPYPSVFPIAQGKIRSAKGHLGAFELMVDDFSQPSPSSRGTPSLEPSRDGAISRCDIVLDLSGGVALFPGADLRDGYVRADPGDPIAVSHAVSKARDLVGTFDKPRYIAFSEDLCAHSRSRIIGCTRCLDLCPAGAIAPAGEHVAIDANICAGCGQCAAACPTGAAVYTMPASSALLGKLRALLLAYREAGGEHAVLLLHDEPHGAPLIGALEQFGGGLPANVLPFSLNELAQIGLEAIAAIFAYGASALRLLLRAKPRHEVLGLYRTIALAEPILAGLGFGAGRIAAIEVDDPDLLDAALRAIPTMDAAPRPASFLPVGDQRGLLRFTLRELHRAAPEQRDTIDLPAHAPFGAVEVDAAGCTLCLSCVAVCPTRALSDDPERPLLRFSEEACVQCGLCEATCPEQVITLRPRVDFRNGSGGMRVLKEEEPYRCIRCRKPFGVKSSVEHVVAKLANKHWMFESPERLDLIRMCEDCRVAYVSEKEFDPYGPAPAPARTTDDYLRERAASEVPKKLDS